MVGSKTKKIYQSTVILMHCTKYPTKLSTHKRTIFVS